MSADDYLETHVIPTRYDSIKQFLKIYENVAHAVNRMQQNYIVHRDFKLGNVLYIDGTFKIADITFLSKIQDINSSSEYLGISRYFPCPSIYGFTALFEYSSNYTSINDTNLISYINSQLATELYRNQFDYSTRLFNDYISLFKDKSFEHNEATILKSYHFNLHEKTTIEMLSRLLFNKYKDDLPQFKTYLFLTIDTYSFGMSLMQVAVHYFINYKDSNRMLLDKLHSIIFKCCEFSVHIKQFDEIYKMYVNFFTTKIEITPL
jgi:serine/threonine protein kinase